MKWCPPNKNQAYLDGIMHKWANPNLKNNETYVIDSSDLINIPVSHSWLDHLVTGFVTCLCSFVFIRFILYLLHRDFVPKIKSAIWQC